MLWVIFMDFKKNEKTFITIPTGIIIIYTLL